MTEGGGSPVDVGAAAAGALLALGVIVPVSVVIAVLDHAGGDGGSSGAAAIGMVGLLCAYAAGGWRSGSLAPDAPLTNGALAGLGAFALWIPIRIAIWAVRPDRAPLVGGTDPVFDVGSVFGAVVLASVVGILGALAAARKARRSGEPAERATMATGGEPAGWPRPGPPPSGAGGDPAEERPDSTGRGAG